MHEPEQPQLRNKRFFWYWPRRGPKGERGVAIVMAVSALALITYLAMQITYESTVEYTVNSQSLNRLKAYYAARSGLEISLLRIKIYQTVMSRYGDKLGPYGQFVDQIWQFPFAWPMSLPPELGSAEKEESQKLVQASTMDAQFATDIQDEGSKIDINDLNSPSKTLRDTARRRLLDLFKHKIEGDESFRMKYGAVNFEELINNIADWMTDKSTSLNGGDKRSHYAELNKDGNYYPPNRAFRTVQELRLVHQMTDDFFDLLAPNITVYGMRGINPNVCNKDVLMSLDPGIDDRVANEILSRREDPNKGGPFQNADDFWAFVQSPPAAARLENRDVREIPLVFDALVSFRVKSTGSFGNSTREIVAIVTDINRAANKIKEFVDKDKKSSQPESEGGPETPPKTASTTPAKSNPLPKGPPRIVYWSER